MYKHKCRDEYLFVAPDGRWRVGPDTSSFKGTGFKSSQKPAPDTPPRTGWQYWLDGEWLDDDTINVEHADGGLDWPCDSSDGKSLTTDSLIRSIRKLRFVIAQF